MSGRSAPVSLMSAMASASGESGATASRSITAFTQHRNASSCAGCHASLPPGGSGMELHATASATTSS